MSDKKNTFGFRLPVNHDLVKDDPHRHITGNRVDIGEIATDNIKRTMDNFKDYHGELYFTVVGFDNFGENFILQSLVLTISDSKEMVNS
jgi:hypothetical protein